jgi:hypothetical protein
MRKSTSCGKRLALVLFGSQRADLERSVPERRQPIPVNLTRKDLKGELSRAISSTYFHESLGTST